MTQTSSGHDKKILANIKYYVLLGVEYNMYVCVCMLVVGAYESNRTYAICVVVVIWNLHVISVAD